jgi:hypothetical protein
MDGTVGRIRGALAIALVAWVPAISARAEQTAAIGKEPAAAVASQDRGTHFRLGLTLGYDQARDDLLVPMRWGGLHAGLRTGLERVAGRTLHEVMLQLPVSLMTNRFDHKALGLGAEIAYTASRRLHRTVARGALVLGGQARGDLHDGFYQSWDEEHLYWLTAYTLGPHVAWRRTRGRLSTVSVEVDLPLVAAVARPPAVRLTKTEPLTHLSHHLLDTSHDLALTGFPRYFALHAGTALTRRWGQGRLILSYDLESNTYDRPARVATLSSRFGLTWAGGR